MITQEQARMAKLVMMLVIVILLFMTMQSARATQKSIEELNAKMKLPFNIGGK